MGIAAIGIRRADLVEITVPWSVLARLCDAVWVFVGSWVMFIGFHLLFVIPPLLRAQFWGVSFHFSIDHSCSGRKMPSFYALNALLSQPTSR